ncbi:MAG: tetratricopeptide repeat protein [Deltaproteobacteria bacterium]|nr:tetratricopeptide repeat protein [Deltaproteobacteria bacterium]MBW2339470.1 tetratricopeptide repeat protein [Deltaproteobacteria bacterium]
MIFDLSWVGFAIWLVLAFVAGLIADRLMRWRGAEKIRRKLDRGDEAFFQGVQHILSNEPDQAIEQFTKSVQINSDTIETYVALANLYSSKGDIERAIRIRQGIILRPNLDGAIRLRAIFDLGLDYKRGGFLNRAVSAFQEVIDSEPNNVEAHEQIERIYEDIHDWEKAFQARQALSKLVKGNHRHILAHHQTELGKVYEKDGDIAGAEKSYKKAISIFDGCVDAYLHLGDLYSAQQEHKAALAKWKKVVDVAPQFTFLAYQRLERAYAKMENPKPVGDFLKEVAERNSDASTQLALARYLYQEGETDSALDHVRQAIESFPSFLDARRFMGEMLLEQGRNEEAIKAYKDLLLTLDFPFVQFQCSNCGYRPDKLVWRCPQCLKWDSMRIIEPSSYDVSNGQLPS